MDQGPYQLQSDDQGKTAPPSAGAAAAGFHPQLGAQEGSEADETHAHEDAAPFRYEDAFSRTIGLITHEEQAILRTRRVAIAGMGGVGGSHLLTLARLGIGSFHIADFDRFDVVNFNRQAGATVSHLQQPKVHVMGQMARDINPTLSIKTFEEGVNENNLDAFLDGVDLYVDGLDFFAVDIRRAVFAACWKKKIPAVTVAPLGMSAALINFIPHGLPGLKGGLSFEQYFRLEGKERDEQYLRFLIGLAPRGLHRKHIVDPASINLAEHRGPSTPMACMLASGIAGTEALKILLKREDVLPAPHGVQFDALGNRIIRTWRPGGMRNVLQRVTLRLARNQMTKMLAQAAAARTAIGDQPAISNQVSQILHLARWAPSGDNTQPWRFEVISADHFAIHGRDTREHCVYDLQGKASQLALGALIETIHIAASGMGLRATVTLRPGSPEDKPVFDVHLIPDEQIHLDSLLSWIPARVTQRRAMSMRALTPEEKLSLQEAVGEDFTLQWHTSFFQRIRMARLLYASARIRLTIPEAFHVHKNAIQWHKRFSEDRIPDKAVGLDPFALLFMRWAMKSWKRVNMLNRYFAGTILPRIQLDFLPGVRCGGHVVLLAKKRAESMDDLLAAGRAMQRFWLTCTALGLQLQPETTPGIFSDYARQDLPFSQAPHAMPAAKRIRQRLGKLIGQDVQDQLVFLCRVGHGSAPTSRSTRLAVDRLRQIHDHGSPMEADPTSPPAPADDPAPVKPAAVNEETQAPRQDDKTNHDHEKVA